LHHNNSISIKNKNSTKTKPLAAETGGFQAKQKMTNHHKHLPVLLEDTLALLTPKANESYLDLTAGFGGHAKAIMEATGVPEHAVLVDRDPETIEQLRQVVGPKPMLINRDYVAALEQDLADRTFDLILMDLGVSSEHLDNAKRGFSFRESGPLDMRLDPRQTLSADEVVNNFSEDELSRIISELGEERRARTVASAIVANRPIKGTEQLADVVRRQVRRFGRIDPATRTFQAIRMYVNDELGQLEGALELIPKRLNPGGRWAVISFHSLEDRLV
jgi:16S rRNA (cytosine1402-N4)-methyltransferase